MANPYPAIPPSLSAYTHAQAMQMAGGEAYMGMLLNNPQMLGIADRASRDLWPGVPLDKLTQTDPNLAFFIKTLGAVAMEKGSQMYPNLIGSQSKLIGGAAFAAGTMRYGPGSHMAGSNLGQGAALGLTNEIVNRIGKEFFDERGLAKPGARGFLQHDFGQLMAEMGNRGMFEGLAPVTAVPMTEAHRAAQLKIAEAAKDQPRIDFLKDLSNKTDFEVNQKEMDRMMGVIRTQGLDVIDQAQRVFGKQSVQDLIGLTERTTGKSISTEAGRQAALTSLPLIGAQAAGQGLDPMSYAQLGGATVAAMSRTLAQAGQIDPGVASSAATVLMPAALRVGQAAFGSNQRMRGYDDTIAAVSREQATFKAMGGMVAAASESPMLVAAAYAADQKGVSGARRAELDKLIGQYTNSRSKDEIVAANDALGKFVHDITGADAYAYADSKGGVFNMLGALRGDTQRQITNALGAGANVEASVFLADQAVASGTAKQLGVSGRDAASKMQRFFGLLDTDAQQGVIEEFRKGGEGVQGRVAGMLREKGYDAAALGMTAEQYAAELAADDARVRANTKGEFGIGSTLNEFRNQLGSAGADMFSNRPSLQNFDRRTQDAYMQQQQLGEHPVDSGDLQENLIRGIMEAALGEAKPPTTSSNSRQKDLEAEQALLEGRASLDQQAPGEALEKAVAISRDSADPRGQGYTGNINDLMKKAVAFDQPGSLTGESARNLKDDLDEKQNTKPQLVYVVNLPMAGGPTSGIG